MVDGMPLSRAHVHKIKAESRPSISISLKQLEHLYDFVIAGHLASVLYHLCL